MNPTGMVPEDFVAKGKPNLGWFCTCHPLAMVHVGYYPQSQDMVAS